MNRAEYRRQQKAEAKKERTYNFISSQLEEYINAASEKRARIAFKENLANHTAAYMQVFSVAMYSALRQAFPDWQMDQQNEIIDLINSEMRKITELVVQKEHGDPAPLSKWCTLNDLDPEEIFAVGKRYVMANPETDEDGSPVIYLD